MPILASVFCKRQESQIFLLCFDTGGTLLKFVFVFPAYLLAKEPSLVYKLGVWNLILFRQTSLDYSSKQNGGLKEVPSLESFLPFFDRNEAFENGVRSLEYERLWKHFAGTYSYFFQWI